MRPALRAATWPFAALAAFACARAPENQATSLETLMKREVALPAAAEVATADGAVRARVAGRLVGEFARTPAGTYFGTFDIGTQVPVACHVFDEANDPASSLAQLSNNLFTGIAAKRKVERKAIAGVDAAQNDGTAYLGIDWIAVIEGAAYQIKQKFGNRGERSLYCVHDESGYSAAFDRFFAEFLESLATPEPPLHREIYILQIGGRDIGFSTVSVVRDATGDFRGDTQVAMLIPSAADQLLASDSYSVEWSRPDGSVISDSSASSDGTSLSQLELKREAGLWKVAGQMQGKAVSESFGVPEVLTSALEETRQMRRVARGDPAELRYWRWVGPASPAKPLEHVMRKTGASSVRSEAGPVRVDTDLDERGATRATMKIGRFEVQMERAYIEGEEF